MFKCQPKFYILNILYSFKLYKNNYKYNNKKNYKNNKK